MKELIEEIQKEIQKENIDGVMDCYTVKVGKGGQAEKRRFNDQLRALTAIDKAKEALKNGNGEEDEIVEVNITDKGAGDDIDKETDGDISQMVGDIFSGAESGDAGKEEDADTDEDSLSGEPESEIDREIQDVLTEFEDGIDFKDKDTEVQQVAVNMGDIETDIETNKPSEKEAELTEEKEEELTIEEDPEITAKKESAEAAGFNIDETIALKPEQMAKIMGKDKPDFTPEETIAEAPDFAPQETIAEKPDFVPQETIDAEPAFSLDEDDGIGAIEIGDFDEQDEDMEFDRPGDASDSVKESAQDMSVDETDEISAAEDETNDDDLEYMNKKEMLKYAKSKGVDQKVFVKLRKLSESKLRKKLKKVLAGALVGATEDEAGVDEKPEKKKTMRLVYAIAGIVGCLIIAGVFINLLMPFDNEQETADVVSVSKDAVEKQQAPLPGKKKKRVNQTELVEDAVSKDLRRSRKQPAASKKSPAAVAKPSKPKPEKPVAAIAPIEKVEDIKTVPLAEAPTEPAQAQKIVDRYMPKGSALAAGRPGPGGAYPYTIHIGSYKDGANANRLVIELRKEGILSFTSYVEIPGKGIWHRAFISFYGSIDDAQQFALKLEREKSLDANVVKKPYVIQAGLFTSAKELQQVEYNLWKKGYTPYSIPDKQQKNRTRLVVGAFDSAKEAQKQAVKMKNERFSATIVKR